MASDSDMFNVFLSFKRVNRTLHDSCFFLDYLLPPLHFLPFL